MHSTSRRTMRKSGFLALILVLVFVATHLRDQPRRNRDRVKRFVAAAAGQLVSDRATAKKQGAFNLGESVGQVAETRVSVERGFYESPVTVEIQCATPDAIIRYTTDGSEPGESRGVTYKDPIEVGKTVVLRAAASKQGWSPSRISTHTYVFPKDVIASQTMRTSITKHPTYGPRLADALRRIPSISLVTSTSITQSQPVRTSFEWLGS